MQMKKTFLQSDESCSLAGFWLYISTNGKTMRAAPALELLLLKTLFLVILHEEKFFGCKHITLKQGRESFLFSDFDRVKITISSPKLLYHRTQPNK